MMILVQNMLEELNSMGASVVTSVKELVSSCKYVILMLLYKQHLSGHF